MISIVENFNGIICEGSYIPSYFVAYVAITCRHPSHIVIYAPGTHPLPPLSNSNYFGYSERCQATSNTTEREPRRVASVNCGTIPANLYFTSGEVLRPRHSHGSAMNAGKSTALLQSFIHYQERGCVPSHIRRKSTIVSGAGKQSQLSYRFVVAGQNCLTKIHPV